MRIKLAASLAQVDLERRIIRGTVYRFGEIGATTAGPLKVRPGALNWPANLTDVTLTREHEHGEIRGFLALVDENDERVYAALKVADGPEGDAALAEAVHRPGHPAKRGGLSFYIENAIVEGDEITYGDVLSIGQVETPAFNSARIDQIAAAATPGTGANTGGRMTEEQRRRLDELRAKNARTAEEETEYQTLITLAVDEAVAPEDPPADPPADAPAVPVAASLPAVPTGVPSARRAATLTRPVSGLQVVVDQIAAAWTRNKMNGDGAIRDAVNNVISAALADVTQTGAAAVERKQWVGELWDGVEYAPMFLPLLAGDGMDNFSGIGWHWTTKPAAVDYAGDKGALTTAAIAVAADNWTAARIAVGHDIDRKFFDFPGEDNAAFVRAYLEACAEAIVKTLDAKALAYILAAGNSTVTAGGVGLGVLKAAATGKVALVNAMMGQAEWVLVNDQDYLGLLDTTASNVPAFLELIGVPPEKMIPSSSVTTKNVLVGVKNTASFRTPKGQPFKVEAQNVANGGIDLVSFAYWATEKHTALGIQKVTWT